MALILLEYISDHHITGFQVVDKDKWMNERIQAQRILKSGPNCGVAYDALFAMVEWLPRISIVEDSDKIKAALTILGDRNYFGYVNFMDHITKFNQKYSHLVKPQHLNPNQSHVYEWVIRKGY